MKKLTLVCTALLAALTLSAQAGTIVETAKSAGNFTTLVAALNAAGKTTMLEEKGPYTVFAPTDAAFAALPKGTVESLMKPENKDKLAAVLAYHVVPGKIEVKDMKTMMAKTANGAELDIKVDGSKVTANGVPVVKADIECSNGVIHVINQVLMPPMAK